MALEGAVLVFDPCEYHLELCNLLCSFGQLTVLQSKNFNVGHYMQTFLPKVFIPAMPIGIIDFHDFILLTMTDWGHKVSSLQNLLASFSCTLFNWSGWILIWCYTVQAEYPDTIFVWNLIKQRIWKLIFWLCQKTLGSACIQTFINQFGWNLVWS